MTLIGLVVGASIFSLPGAMAASAGPAVIISYLLASVVALFSCLVAARIGALFPVSGASYIAISRILSPAYGFLAVWLMLLSAAVAVAFLAYVFADYLNLLLVLDLERRGIALCVVAVFGAINVLSARVAVLGQELMVLMFMLALIVFCVGGLSQINIEHILPFAPNGMLPVLYAAVPAFFSFIGFMMIVELSGEIKEPEKTIPQALFISFGVVLIIYAAVSLTIVGNIHWSALGGLNAPVGIVAKQFLPAWTAGLISATALAAAATSVNGILLGYSRDVMVLAEANLFPQMFARKSSRSGEPLNAVALLSVVSGLCVLGGGRIIQYASLIVLATMLLQILLGVSLLAGRRKMPDEYDKLKQPCGRYEISVSGAGLIVTSTVFLIIGFVSDPATGILAIAYTAVGATYYFLRTRYNDRQTVTRSLSN